MSGRILLDVSGYQGAVDFAQVRRWNPEVAGVIIKASEGRWGGTNAYFDQQYQSAKEAAYPVGFYCFDHTSVDAIQQADIYLARVAGKPAFCHTLDFEGNDAGLGPAAVQGHIATWLHEVNAERAETPMVYTAPWAWDGPTGYMDASRYPLWQAAYLAQLPGPPAHWNAALMWQFTDSYRVPFGACDASLFTGTDAQWAALLGGSNPLEDDMTPQQDALLKEIGLTVMTIASRQQQQANIIIHGKASPTDTAHWGLDQTGQALRQLVSAHNSAKAEGKLLAL